jgi:hypothetical protein
MENILTAYLEGKKVVLKSDPRTFTVTGGFGANPDCAGRKIFVDDEQGNPAGYITRDQIKEILE